MFNLPKKITICGREWEIVKVNDASGGSFEGNTAKIKIGIKHQVRISNTFFHEVLEAILTERGHRYVKYADNTNDGRIFTFTHAEFENIIADLDAALGKLLK